MLYDIAEGKSKSELKMIVHANLKNGWKPLGGLTIMPSINRTEGPIYMQSMINENEYTHDSGPAEFIETVE